MCKNGGDFSELESQMMGAALELARVAMAREEVPVGAVLYTADGDVVGGAYNQMLARKDASAHAEVLALRLAGRLRRNYRLPDLRMAVTLEPCAMCIGAVLHARLSHVVFGATDARGGACGGVLDVAACRALNHHTQVQGGLRADEAAALLRAFFVKRR